MKRDKKTEKKEDKKKEKKKKMLTDETERMKKT